eukprot:Amastigsp_a182811_11.p2 type:complete len:156 gc:universal Amastigsp_a182811_11:1081-1548(+)
MSNWRTKTGRTVGSCSKSVYAGQRLASTICLLRRNFRMRHCSARAFTSSSSARATAEPKSKWRTVVPGPEDSVREDASIAIARRLIWRASTSAPVRRSKWRRTNSTALSMCSVFKKSLTLSTCSSRVVQSASICAKESESICLSAWPASMQSGQG